MNPKIKFWDDFCKVAKISVKGLDGVNYLGRFNDCNMMPVTAIIESLENKHKFTNVPENFLKIARRSSNNPCYDDIDMMLGMLSNRVKGIMNDMDIEINKIDAGEVKTASKFSRYWRELKSLTYEEIWHKHDRDIDQFTRDLKHAQSMGYTESDFLEGRCPYV